MNEDTEKDLIEKINRLEKKIDYSNHMHKTSINNIQNQLNTQENGLIILFWGGVVVIIICAIVLN